MSASFAVEKPEPRRRVQWMNPMWTFGRWALRSGERVCTETHAKTARGRPCPACRAQV